MATCATSFISIGMWPRNGPGKPTRRLGAGLCSPSGSTGFQTSTVAQTFWFSPCFLNEEAYDCEDGEAVRDRGFADRPRLLPGAVRQRRDPDRILHSGSAIHKCGLDRGRPAGLGALGADHR